jgi:adenosine deaminase
MTKPTDLDQDADLYRSLPKVELHRHLEGSLRLGTLREIDRALKLGLPDTQKLRELVQIGDAEEYTFENFLSKFQTLRLFYRSPEYIERLTYESIEDAARDHVRYIELRFTPEALGRAEGFDLGAVMDWVIRGKQRAERDFGIKSRLIASVNRHESIELAMRIVELAIERADKGIVGLDLAGNEAKFTGTAFLGVFKKAQSAGLHITIHAGEWGPADNVSDAILYLNAERIGHGVRVLDDPHITALARERNIPFEVCVTSNYQSGVVPSGSVHPLRRMIDQGLNVTINTDDPSISQIQLSDEYRLVVEDLGVPLYILRERVIAAAQAAFITDEEKLILLQEIAAEFSLPG